MVAPARNPNYKLFYDCNVFTSHYIGTKQPELALIDGIYRCTNVIDVACVIDYHV